MTASAPYNRERPGAITQTSGGDSLSADTVTTFFVGLVMFFAISRAQEIIPGLSHLRLVLVLIAVALLRVLAVRSSVRFLRIGDSSIARAVFAMMLLGCVSVLYSAWRGGSAKYLYEIFSVAMVFFLLTYKTASSVKVIRSYMLAVAIAGLSLGLLAVVFSKVSRLRVSTSYDPNDTAMMICTSLAIMISYWRRFKGMRRLMLTAGCGAMAFAVLLTQSRGGFITMGVLALHTIWCIGRGGAANARQVEPARPVPGGARLPPKGVKKSRWGAAFVALLAFGVLGAVSWRFAPADARDRLLTVFSLGSDYNLSDDTMGRGQIWRRAIRSMVQTPWGVGIGVYNIADGRLGGKYKAAHNSFLQIGVELGWLGLFLFLRALWLVWRTLSGAHKLAGEDAADRVHLSRIEVEGLQGLFLAFVVAGFFLSAAYSYILYAMFAMVASIEYLNARSAAQAMRRASAPRSDAPMSLPTAAT